MNENIENYSRDWTRHCYSLFANRKQKLLDMQDIESQIVKSGIENLFKVIGGKPTKPEKEFCMKIIEEEFNKLTKNE